MLLDTLKNVSLIGNILITTPWCLYLGVMDIVVVITQGNETQLQVSLTGQNVAD